MVQSISCNDKNELTLKRIDDIGDTFERDIFHFTKK